MNPRERILAGVLLVVVVLGGGAFLYLKVFLPELEDRRAGIEKLKKENQEKEDKIKQVLGQRPTLDKARHLSLPPDVDLARREYENYLTNLLHRNGFAAGSFRVTPEQPDTNSSPKLGVGTRREPIYTSLPFTVQAHGSLYALVETLEHFYDTSLLHRVKSLSIQRPLTTSGPQAQQPQQPQMPQMPGRPGAPGAPQRRAGELDINFTVEALVLAGAPPRSYLLPNINRLIVAADAMAALRHGPTGLGIGLWALSPTGLKGPRTRPQPSRLYASIAGKDIFFGMPTERNREEVEVTRFVFLTDISITDGTRQQAFLYDRWNNRHQRLRASAGFDTFKIVDGEETALAKVVRINDRDLIFRVDESYYMIHVGQSLGDALKKPLTAEQQQVFGLVAIQEK
jgi:hypothetical protein